MKAKGRQKYTAEFKDQAVVIMAAGNPIALELHIGSGMIEASHRHILHRTTRRSMERAKLHILCPTPHPSFQIASGSPSGVEIPFLPYRPQKK